MTFRINNNGLELITPISNYSKIIKFQVIAFLAMTNNKSQDKLLSITEMWVKDCFYVDNFIWDAPKSVPH